MAQSKMKTALITSEKMPKVKIVIGKATSLTTGLIKILITPSTTAKMTAARMVTNVPGTK